MSEAKRMTSKDVQEFKKKLEAKRPRKLPQALLKLERAEFFAEYKKRYGGLHPSAAEWREWRDAREAEKKTKKDKK